MKSILYKAVEFEVLHGASEAESELMFKLRSGTRGLSKELGRHKERGVERRLLCN